MLLPCTNVVAAYDQDNSNHRPYQTNNSSWWRMAASHKQPPSQTDLVQRRADDIFLNCKEIGWLGDTHFALKSKIFHPRCWQPCHFPRMEIFGRAGIHGRRTSWICNLNLISKSAWQFIQHRSNKRENEMDYVIGLEGSKLWARRGV